MTSFDFISIKSSGVELHGLRSGTTGPCAIHVHGTWGNFYENPFALQLSDTYRSAGWSYASINTSGHDGGSIQENFETSLPEIEDWVAHLNPDDQKVILQGHSLGALKLLRLVNDEKYSRLVARTSAIVLLSPFDIVAFNGGTGEELRERRARAQRLNDEVGGDAFVTSDIFDVWPLSVKTYLQATDSGGRWDLFPTRENSIGVFADIRTPIFVAIGGSDFASYPDPKTAAELISRHEPAISLSFIEGAPHNFAGHEHALGNAIRDFLRTLPAT